MNYENKERELNLKALCFCVARKWKQMLIVALVFALVLGGFQGWKKLSVVTDSQTEAALQAAYEADYAKYLDQVSALNTKITQIQADIRNHGTYMEESVLMGIDYRNTWVSSVNLYIQTKENETISGHTLADMIADAYRSAIAGEYMLAEAAETVKIAPQYLRELISIPVPKYQEFQEGPLVTVMIRSGDEETAQKITNAMLAGLDLIQGEIAGSMGQHTIRVVNTNTVVTVDDELAERQEDAAERLVDYLDDLEDYRYSLSQLSAPAMPVLATNGGVMKSAIKYAIVGFLAGAFLVAGWASIAYVVGDKVYSAEELKSRFEIAILGKISLKAQKRCCMDRCLDALENRGKTEEQGALAVIQASVRNYCHEGKTLLVAGTAGEEAVEKIAKSLAQISGVEVISGGSLLDCVAAVEGLGKCDMVVLVERCGISRYSRIGAQLEKVVGVNKQLLGCVVLEK